MPPIGSVSTASDLCPRQESTAVRRPVPWLLLSLVVMGSVAGAALGISQKSSTTPSQWVAGAIAATKQAGSAHFSYTQVTSSPNAELRGSIQGHGAADFATGAVSVTEIDNDIGFTSSNNQPLHPVPSSTTVHGIEVGGTLYEANPIPGIPFTHKYHQLSFRTLPRARQGLALALNAEVALDSLRGQFAVASITDVGSVDVDGLATTKYEVQYEPLHVCLAHKAPLVLTQRPSQVWLDGDGRLVRVRSTLSFNTQPSQGVKVPPSMYGFPTGPVTTVATLTFADFGTPVHVSAPPASELFPQRHASSAKLIIHSHACRS